LDSDWEDSLHIKSDHTTQCGEEIFKRPFLGEFIEYCFARFKNVAIWTAAGEYWANEVIQHILKKKISDFAFVFTANRCTRKTISSITSFYPERITIKPLRKVWRAKYRELGFNRENTLIIDDTPATCNENYGNAIYIPTFSVWQSKDNYLQRLCWYLDSILEYRDVRWIEKRIWAFEYDNYQMERAEAFFSENLENFGIFQKIFSFLDTADVVHVSSVNKSLNRICNDERLWKQMCRQSLRKKRRSSFSKNNNPLLISKEEVKWKEVFKQIYVQRFLIADSLSE